MNHINQGILFFFVLLALSFLLKAKRDQLSQIKINTLNPKLKITILSTIIATAILGMRVIFTPTDTWSAVALWMLLLSGWTFSLKRIECPREIIRLWLIVCSLVGTLIFPFASSISALCCALLALVIYTLLEDYLFNADNNIEDILPPAVWLSALAWADLTSKNEANIANILLACLSISLILQWLPAKFISNDKYFVKRIVLSLCAGLALLIVLKTILLPPNMMILAALFAGGIFFNYFYQNHSSDDDLTSLVHSTVFLITLGILTLLATRLIGDIGLIILSAACCINASKGMLAALFWISRLLIQGFVLHNVDNVTGINLMHPYCSAALFFGFLAILFLSLILHINSQPINTRQSTVLASFLILGLLVPPAIIYLIHEEPTASFLIATNVVAISLVSFASLIYKQTNAIEQNNLMLMPLFLSSTALLLAPLIEIGNHATVASRLQIVSYAIAALIVIYFVLSNVKKVTRNPV